MVLPSIAFVLFCVFAFLLPLQRFAGLLLHPQWLRGNSAATPRLSAIDPSLR